jgi:hypothetical protein
MNTISHPQSSLTPEHVQVRKWARVALILSSIAAVPGFLYSLYPIYLLFISVVEGPDGGNWTTLLTLLGIMLTGWWLYWTYWQEVKRRNRYGKMSWLVSALFNGGLVSYYILTAVQSLMNGNVAVTINWFIFAGMTLWVLVMTVISLWVWVLKIRRTA